MIHRRALRLRRACRRHSTASWRARWPSARATAIDPPASSPELRSPRPAGRQSNPRAPSSISPLGRTAGGVRGRERYHRATNGTQVTDLRASDVRGPPRTVASPRGWDGRRGAPPPRRSSPRAPYWQWCGDRGAARRRAARHTRRVGRRTASDVRDAVEAFATAYTREDAGALSTLLAREVSRVTPSDVQRGRGSVVREYRRQFAANPTERYVLTDMLVRPGSIGRASGRYVVSRLGRGPITGRVAFGVHREQGRPRVGLIAATPDR